MGPITSTVASMSMKRKPRSHAATTEGVLPLVGSDVEKGRARVGGLDPMVEPSTSEALKARIEAVIEREVRPGLRADGGDVEVVGVDSDQIVQVRLLGSCSGCASSIYTMTMGIEAAVRTEVPEIRFLEAVL